MKPKTRLSIRHSVGTLLLITFSATTLQAGTNWDAGGGLDTNINTPTNWDLDTLPDLTGPATVTFGIASGTATINTPVEFVRTVISNSFTLADGAGSLTYRGTSSGTNSYGIQATSTAPNVQINEPILVESVATANPLGNLFLIYNNQTTSDTTTLSINGGIALALSSTATSYNLRYGNNTSGNASTSNTRIAGTISGMGTLQNSSANGAWAGDLIIAGDQASLANTDITISLSGSGFLNPTATARLVLGESSTDEQTWRNITLNNVMNLAVGGTITAGTFNGNVTGSSITGYGSGGTISFTGGEIGVNVALGGGGTDQNNLSLTKKGSGTLIIRSSSATYTGATTVEAGTLSIASTATLASPIKVKAGATLSSEGRTTSSLTFDKGTSTLNFDTTTPGSFSAGSVITTEAAIVANPVGATIENNSYTVLTKTLGTFSGADVAAFIAGGRGTMGGAGTSSITYTATAPASLTWKGTDGTNPTFWDVGTTSNWDNSGTDRFYSNDSVTFNDTASSFAVAIQGASVTPGNMVFNHSNNYTISGGTIVGTGSLTKSGSGTLTLAQASGSNSFSGALNINGGTLSISSLNRIGGGGGTRAIQLGGGTLEYTYTTSNAETTDTVPVILNTGNSGISITGSYITGSVNAPTAAVTLRLGAPITGSGNLIKSGSGILSIGKNSATYLGNTFTGTLTVTAGALDIRNPDSLGDTIRGTTLNNAQLELFSFGQNAGVSFDPEPITVIGSSFIRSKNEDTDSDIRHELTGSLTLSPSSVVGIASPKAVALSSTVANTINSISSNISSLEISGQVSTGAGSIIKLGLAPSVVLPIVQSNAPQTVTLSGAITGTGAVETQGEATSLYTLANPEYSGNTTVNGGILSLGADNSSNNASSISIAATGATLDLNYTGTDTVNTLFIGGVQKSAGVWGSVASGAPNTDPALTGTGTLTVASGPAGGYASWSAANAPGQSINQDHDNDGVANGIEYFMGLSGSSFTANPVLNGSNTIVWPMGASFAGLYGTDYSVQTSENLTTWNNVVAGNVTIVPGVSLTYTLSGTGKRFVRLMVNDD